MGLVILLVLAAFQAHAAFRVYKHRVIHYDAFGNVVKKETVLSTLDHLQYEHYHGGYRWAHVELVDTWYCPGDTSRRHYCDPPKQRNRVPASLEREKRIEIPYNHQPVIP